MESKLHGLPPLKRFRLMQREKYQDESLASSILPAKKRKESRSSPPFFPISTTYCLPAKKRVWSLDPSLFTNEPFCPVDPILECKPSSERQESVDSIADIGSVQVTEDKEEIEKVENEEMDASDSDDGILCSICQSTDGDPSDPIVFCDGCDLMVHTTCYGHPLSKRVPKGDWFCAQCLVSQSLKWKKSETFSCCLCPVAGGAMKPTSNGRWAHIVCALFVPEVFFLEPDGREGIDCTKVPSKRWKQRCFVCNSTSGCVIDCSEPKCPLAFHVTCGLNEDLCIEYIEGRNKDVVAGFCKCHTDLWKKQMQTGKFKIVARLEDKK